MGTMQSRADLHKQVKNPEQRSVKQVLRMWWILNSETEAQVDSQENEKHSLPFCLPKLHKTGNLNCVRNGVRFGSFVSREPGKDAV